MCRTIWTIHSFRYGIAQLLRCSCRGCLVVMILIMNLCRMSSRKPVALCCRRTTASPPWWITSNSLSSSTSQSLSPTVHNVRVPPSMSLTMKANQPCNKSRHSLTTPMIVQSFPLPSCLAPQSRSTSLQEASSRLHLRVTQAMALRTTHSPMSIPLVIPSTGRSMRR